jgi:predicted GTPase
MNGRIKLCQIKWIEVIMQSTVPTAEVNESVSDAEARVADGVAGKCVKVMVIDDSKTIRRTAETLLKKEGFEVITATDGSAEHDRRPSAQSDPAGYHDATSGRLPDVCIDQASSGFPSYTRDHALQQGWLV